MASQSVNIFLLCVMHCSIYQQVEQDRAYNFIIMVDRGNIKFMDYVFPYRITAFFWGPLLTSVLTRKS